MASNGGIRNKIWRMNNLAANGGNQLQCNAWHHRRQKMSAWRRGEIRRWLKSAWRIGVQLNEMAACSNLANQLGTGVGIG